MKFILIFGPQAVGKMTVGHELEKITDLKLFHNHMTIDLVSPFFDYGTPIAKKLVEHFRTEILEAVAQSDLSGLIFTYIWNFDTQHDWDQIEKFCEIFRRNGGEICMVELEAEVDERIARNKTPHRLEHKPSKRNLERSEKDLINSVASHRMNSLEGEIKEKNYIRINNSKISPEKVAGIIKERFGLNPTR
ncbi:MAG: AAA family ATPase [bacterium]